MFHFYLFYFLFNASTSFFFSVRVLERLIEEADQEIANQKQKMKGLWAKEEDLNKQLEDIERVQGVHSLAELCELLQRLKDMLNK